MSEAGELERDATRAVREIIEERQKIAYIEADRANAATIHLGGIPVPPRRQVRVGDEPEASDRLAALAADAVERLRETVGPPVIEPLDLQANGGPVSTDAAGK